MTKVTMRIPFGGYTEGGKFMASPLDALIGAIGKVIELGISIIVLILVLIVAAVIFKVL